MSERAKINKLPNTAELELVDETTQNTDQLEYGIKETATKNLGIARMPITLVGQMHKGRKNKLKAIAASYSRDLFSDLDNDIRNDIEEYWSANGNTKSQIYIGIGLDDDKDWNIVDTLVALLHKKSQTSYQDANDYYMGNGSEAQMRLITIGGTESKTPVILTTKGEWIKAFTLSKDPSSAEKKKAMEALKHYASKPFYMEYTEFSDEEYTTRGGKTKTKKKATTIKRFSALYALGEKVDSEQLLDQDGNPVLDKDGKVVMQTKAHSLIITLDPIFRKQIENHYILKPLDLRSKLLAAYREATGTKNKTPDSLLPFIYQLLDAQHNQGGNGISPRTYRVRQNTIVVTKDGKDEVMLGLFDMISSGAVKGNKVGRLQQQLDTYIEVAKRIGLLERHWTEQSADTGNIIHNFQVVDAETWKGLNK